MRLTFSLLCALPLAGGCSPTPPPTVESELETLQGHWEAISHDFRGSAAPAEADFFPYKLSFTGDRVTETRGETVKEATVTLEPSRSPRGITFHYPPFHASWGTYVLDGDELEISWAPSSTALVFWPSVS